MWTAIRLLTVFVLAVSGLFALRSGVPSHSPRPPTPAIRVDVRASNLEPVNLITETDATPTADEDVKKVVTVEKFRVAALQANAKADPEPEQRRQYRRQIHRHLYRGKRRHRR